MVVDLWVTDTGTADFLAVVDVIHTYLAGQVCSELADFYAKRDLSDLIAYLTDFFKSIIKNIFGDVFV